MLRGDQISKLIFDYNTEELFYVFPNNTCKTTNLTTDDNNLLFGNLQIAGGIHVFSTNGAIHFAQKYGQQYMGKKVVRGINCDQWRTCLQWAPLKSTFTLDYYFTDQSWLSSSAYSQVPVRAEIFGTQQQDGATSRQFYHIYDYTDFTTTLDPLTTVFETPHFVTCKGRLQLRSVPTLPNAFSYREEIISSVGITSYADVWFDTQYKLLRLDYRPAYGSPPYYSNDSITEVHDYTIGVGYAIDRVMKNCSIIPLQNNSFDASITNLTFAASKQQFILKMKSPQDLFYLDNNFTYTGRRRARGLNCDVFIRTREDFPLGLLKVHAVLEFYFLANDKTEQNNAGALTQTSKDVPVQLNVNIPGESITLTYNFFNFDPEDPEITNFDVSPCFTADKKISFKLTYIGNFDATAISYKQIFLFQTISTVAQAAQVTPLRISNPTMYMDQAQAYFVATLLEKAPSIMRYQKIQGKVVQSHNDATFNGFTSASDCADQCTTFGNWTCNSFEFCPTTKTCTLSKIHTADGNVLQSTQSCDLYDRTLGSPNFAEVPLNTAWNNLRNAVAKKVFKINVQFDKNVKTYTAQTVSNSIVDNPDVTTVSNPNLYTCVPNPGVRPTQPSEPPLPVVPNTFSTKLEAIIADRNQTVSGEEYFDENNNRAALFMLRGDQISKLIFDYNTEELFYVYPDNTCKTSNLTTDDNNLLFGNLQIAGGIHVFSTNGAIHFAQKYGQQYMGKKVVRGINCDQWRTCLQWAPVNSTFTLDYYFTDQSWLSSSAYSQVPVRAEIFGTQLQDGAPSRQFHHIYDYTDFTTTLDPLTTVFETPHFVTCKGRLQLRSVPTLPNAFSYREEIISSVGITSYADVWFDTQYKLLRLDYRPSYGSPPYYSNDSITEVHDYTIGVGYAIDRVMQNCSIIPLQNNSFDASITNLTVAASKQQFILKMKSPQDLFYLDNNFTYTGRRRARGLNCDVFIRTREDFPLGPLKVHAVLEFYFLANDQTEQNNAGALTQTSKDVPVQLNVNIPGESITLTYNFFNFDPEDPEITNFDVSPCFTSDKKISFKLTYSGNFDATAISYKQIFLFQTISTVAQAAQVTPLRIANPTMYMDQSQAYFVATLLEKAPSIMRYQQIQGKVIQYHNDATFTGFSSASDCADQCTTFGNWTCNSFEFCPTTQTCTLSKIHTADGNVLQSTQSCDLYDRTLGSPNFAEVPLNTAWNNLRNAVAKKVFKINVQFDKDVKTYSAQTVSNNIVDNPNVTPVSTNVMSQFKPMPNKAVPHFDNDVLSGVSIDDCAQACISSFSYVCNSFEYQYATSYCLLSTLHPDEKPSMIQTSVGVDLYIRDYTSKFVETAGTTVLSSSNTIYQMILDTNQCAKLCVDYQGFPCKSFDYCPDIGTCYLGRSHVYDVPKAQIQSNPMCNHWSRRYLDDFQLSQSNTIIKLVNDRIISDVNLYQCAKACVEMEGGSCATFSYCSKVSECRLSTAALSNVGQTGPDAVATCNVYSRKSFPDGTPYIANPQKYYGNLAANSQKGYSKGGAAGVAIVMILVGVILTALVLFLYIKFSNKGGDDMTIKFSRQVDDE
uniref:Uncharacterized protein LOC111121934 n=1 Tax=Crassostrea virginica TaxID=6565 RepID=A0A8B8CXC7_CRAVI|nr:uncharacterized protein LOC111121934 [Crassostrea virginica]